MDGCRKDCGATGTFASSGGVGGIEGECEEYTRVGRTGYLIGGSTCSLSAVNCREGLKWDNVSYLHLYLIKENAVALSLSKTAWQNIRSRAICDLHCMKQFAGKIDVIEQCCQYSVCIH